MNRCFFFLLLLISVSAHADPMFLNANDLSESSQLALLMTPSWDSVNGKIQRYERDLSQWKKVGEPIPVVVGKNGMAWGIAFQDEEGLGPVKKEGDMRTPVGIFKVGPAFGFATQATDDIKLAYLPLLGSSYCVDDIQSKYYNQLVDSSKISNKDWQSAEAMRETPLYRLGSLIQYNMPEAVQGRGSCIFLHIWRNPKTGTAGCVAMDENNLKHLLAWFDPKKKPVIAMFAAPSYRYFREGLHLPKINNN